VNLQSRCAHEADEGTRKDRAGRCRRTVSIAVLLAVGVLFGVQWVGLSGCGTWLDVGQTGAGCAYAMVLGGDPNGRAYAAAALVRAGLAERVLLSRVALELGTCGNGLPEHEVSRRVLLSRGVPESNVLVLGPEVSTTRDEALALAEFLEDHPTERVAVVTNDFHTRRAQWIFRRILGCRAENLQFVSAPNDDFVLQRWWQTQTGFETVVGENLKLLFYVVRYDRRAMPIIAGLAVLVVAWGRARWRRTRLHPDRQTHQGREGPCEKAR